jgi:hypothetical protein
MRQPKVVAASLGRTVHRLAALRSAIGATPLSALSRAAPGIGERYVWETP